MGNQPGKLPHNNQSGRRKKMVHWKSAEWPQPAGRPILITLPDQLPDVVSLRWERPKFDGGSPITGYFVEHRRMGSPHWVRSTPNSVTICEVSISGLEPGWRYQFRVFAENIVGRSNPSELSDPLTVTLQRNAISVPRFVDELLDTNAVEDERVEFRVRVLGQPPPEISWLKDGYEIFSSRRTKIVTDNDVSVLVIHQVALTDEGEIKCTATNRAGHTVTKARLSVQAPPKIRLPRAYEDGLLVEADEALRLKVGVAGQPTPNVVWLHEGNEIENFGRFEITNTERNSLLKIDNVERDDRGEYGIRITNKLGEDFATFLVTVTARPNPPGRVQLNMSFGKSATLSWTAPQDDGGCKIGSYIVEYFRVGWNVWLKATTTRSLNATLNDLIEGSEYKFRVKAENPYGVSDPSPESNVLFIPDPKRGITKPKSDRNLASDIKQATTKHKSTRSKTLSPSRPQKDAATDMSRVHFSPDVARKQKPKIIENDELHREMCYGTSNKALMNEIGKSAVKPLTQLPNPPTSILKSAKEKSPLQFSKQNPPTPPERKESLTLEQLPYTNRKDSLTVEPVIQSTPRRSLSPAIRIHPPPALQRSSEPVVEDDNKPSSSLKSSYEKLPEIASTKETSKELTNSTKRKTAGFTFKSTSPLLYNTEKFNRTPSPQPATANASEVSTLEQNRSKLLYTQTDIPMKSSNTPLMVPLGEKHEEVHTSNEFMLVVFDKKCSVNDKSKQDSFELDLEDAIQPPSISISSPDLGSLVFTNLQTFPLRRSVSSTELLYERAMARFYEAVELEEAEKARKREVEQEQKQHAISNIQSPNAVIRKRLGSMTEAERLSFERRSELRRQSVDISTNLKSSLRWSSRDNLEKLKTLTRANDYKLQKQDSKNTEEESDIHDDSVRAYSLPNRGESTDLGSDYTESTASDEQDSIEKFKIELMARTRSSSPLELETYHPRDMSAGVFTPYRSPEPDHDALILNRPLPLPSPDFVPKPILKRPSNENFTTENLVNEVVQDKKHKTVNNSIENTENKHDFAKGIKSFFKRDKPNTDKNTTEPTDTSNVKSNATQLPSAEEVETKRKLKEEEELKRKEAERVMHEEALAAVDLYSDIVSSVSKTRNYRTPLYIDSDKLKKFAETKMPSEDNDTTTHVTELGTRKTSIPSSDLLTMPISNKPRLSISERGQLLHVRLSPSELAVSETDLNKPNIYKTAEESSKTMDKTEVEQKPMPPIASEVKEKRTIKVKRIIKKRVPSRSRTRESSSSRVPLQPTVSCSTEELQQKLATQMNAEKRASDENLTQSVSTTVVEQVSEKEAHEKVHSALSYSTDLVLFLVACYVYLFKEAKLVLPILALMIYRQLGEAIQNWTPNWLRRQKKQ